MITLNGKRVELESVDADNFCTVKLDDGRYRAVSAFRLRGTDYGNLEVARAVRAVKVKVKQLENGAKMIWKLIFYSLSGL